MRMLYVHALITPLLIHITFWLWNMSVENPLQMFPFKCISIMLLKQQRQKSLVCFWITHNLLEICVKIWTRWVYFCCIAVRVTFLPSCFEFVLVWIHFGANILLMVTLFLLSMLMHWKSWNLIFWDEWIDLLLLGVLLLLISASKKASDERLFIARYIVSYAERHVADHVELAGRKCLTPVCYVLVMEKKRQRGILCRLQSRKTSITCSFCILKWTSLSFMIRWGSRMCIEMS